MSYRSDFTRGCASAARSLWKLAGKLIGHQPPPKTLGEKVQGCGCMMIFPLFFLTFWLVKWMVMATAALALITAATGCSLAAGVGLIVDLFPSKAKKAWIPPPRRIPPPTFPAEPYFTATNLAPVLPGAEYPVFGPTVTLSCFKCHADVEVAASASDYRCSACGERLYMRSCPHCPKTLVIGEALHGHSIKCLSCQHTSNWKAIDNRRVTADHAPGRKVPAAAAPRPQATAPTPATQPPSSAPSADKPSVAARMKDLSELHNSGLISDEEFAAKRTALIAEL